MWFSIHYAHVFFIRRIFYFCMNFTPISSPHIVKMPKTFFTGCVYLSWMKSIQYMYVDTLYWLISFHVERDVMCELKCKYRLWNVCWWCWWMLWWWYWSCFISCRLSLSKRFYLGVCVCTTFHILYIYMSFTIVG